MFGLGMGEIIVVFFLILLLFGAKNIPEIARALGKAVQDFKKAANEVRSGLDIDLSKEPLDDKTHNTKNSSAPAIEKKQESDHSKSEEKS